MDIIPLSEGTFAVDTSKMFIPVQPVSHVHHAKGSLLVEVQPFLVKTKNDLILIDTGLGIKNNNGVQQCIQNIRDAGYSADDISKVLISHLHKDHAGGLVNPYTGHLNFENAVYYIQEREIAYALQSGSVSYNTETAEVMKNSEKTFLLKGDSGVISDYIHYMVTSAHSKFHQVFWIKENDETIFYGGDDAPQYDQLKRKFVAKYDYDGKRASLLREEWLKEAKNGKWVILFYHDVKHPFFQTY